jgi:hypothetical protein
VGRLDEDVDVGVDGDVLRDVFTYVFTSTFMFMFRVVTGERGLGFLGRLLIELGL